MELIHRILSYVAIVIVALGIGWSLGALRNPALGGRRLDRYQVLVVAVLVVAGVAGVGLLITGGHPGENLHLVYAAIAIGVIPLARSFAPAADRRAGIAALAAFVVLGFVLYRLFATG